MRLLWARRLAVPARILFACKFLCLCNASEGLLQELTRFLFRVHNQQEESCGCADCATRNACMYAGKASLP